VIAIAATPVAAVSPAVAEYRFTVRGSAGQAVHVRTAGVPKDWLVTFCTRKVCTPYRFDGTLDGTGRAHADLRVFPTGEPHRAFHAFTVYVRGGRTIVVTLR